MPAVEFVVTLLCRPLTETPDQLVRLVFVRVAFKGECVSSCRAIGIPFWQELSASLNDVSCETHQPTADNAEYSMSMQDTEVIRLP